MYSVLEKRGNATSKRLTRLLNGRKLTYVKSHVIGLCENLLTFGGLHQHICDAFEHVLQT